MALRTPALAAAALFVSALAPTAAHAASARIAPAFDSGTVGYTVANVGLRHDDDCRYRIVAGLYNAEPGTSALPVWRSRVALFNGCRTAQWFEDGSMIDRVVIKFPTTRLAHGRAILAIAIGTRTYGGRWVTHSYVRSFWH